MRKTTANTMEWCVEQDLVGEGRSSFEKFDLRFLTKLAIDTMKEGNSGYEI
jgi:hypothetical protein